MWVVEHRRRTVETPPDILAFEVERVWDWHGLERRGPTSLSSDQMTVIADITVPADAFVLGRALQDVPNVEVELQRVVPLYEQVALLLWVVEGDRRAAETALRDSPEIDVVTMITNTAGGTLFEVEWANDLDGVVRALRESRARVLEASGTAESWNFRLRFTTHENLSRCNILLTEDGIPVTLRHLYDPAHLPKPESLSTKQRDALLTAYRNGYFEVPRGITQTELAERLDLSDSAFSQRVRRGVASLIEQMLLSEEQPRR